MNYIFTNGCSEDLGSHFEGAVQGPEGLDIQSLRTKYYDILTQRKYNPDGSRITIGDLNNGYIIPSHPGSFADFVISNDSQYIPLECMEIEI